ncbi:hypothetical protein [Pseudomonas putida]|uniref:hypothetical protein n=1 Tax=Pseudomonas putida TaxID=303 RepID=UPI00037F29A9|nr:hypothetical protein [Pseudomonas putida]
MDAGMGKRVQAATVVVSGNTLFGDLLDNFVNASCKSRSQPFACEQHFLAAMQMQDHCFFVEFFVEHRGVKHLAGLQKYTGNR